MLLQRKNGFQSIQRYVIDNRMQKVESAYKIHRIFNKIMKALFEPAPFLLAILLSALNRVILIFSGLFR